MRDTNNVARMSETTRHGMLFKHETMRNIRLKPKLKPLHQRQSGFTLIEIIVVVVIISMLAALVAPKFLGRVDDARVAAAKSDVQSISAALALYRLDNFNYPSTSQGLQALVANPGNAKNWKGYLDKVPNDPWGNEYQYLSPGQKASDYDLWSNGSDGAQGGTETGADIGNWNLDE